MVYSPGDYNYYQLMHSNVRETATPSDQIKISLPSIEFMYPGYSGPCESHPVPNTPGPIYLDRPISDIYGRNSPLFLLFPSEIVEPYLDIRDHLPRFEEVDQTCCAAYTFEFYKQLMSREFISIHLQEALGLVEDRSGLLPIDQIIPRDCHSRRLIDPYIWNTIIEEMQEPFNPSLEFGASWKRHLDFRKEALPRDVSLEYWDQWFKSLTESYPGLRISGELLPDSLCGYQSRNGEDLGYNRCYIENCWCGCT